MDVSKSMINYLSSVESSLWEDGASEVKKCVPSSVCGWMTVLAVAHCQVNIMDKYCKGLFSQLYE